MNQTHYTNTEQAGRTLLNQMYSSLCSSFEPVSRAHSLNRKDWLGCPERICLIHPKNLIVSHDASGFWFWISYKICWSMDRHYCDSVFSYGDTSWNNQPMDESSDPAVSPAMLCHTAMVWQKNIMPKQISPSILQEPKGDRQLYLKQIKGFILQPHEHIWVPRCLPVFVEGKSSVIMCIFWVHKQKTSVHFPTG